MIGIPMELTPEFREDAPIVFLNESAAHDATIVGRMQKQLANGKSVVVTSGLVKALAGKGIETLLDLEVTIAGCWRAGSPTCGAEASGRPTTTSCCRSSGIPRTTRRRQSRRSPGRTASRSSTTRTTGRGGCTSSPCRTTRPTSTPCPYRCWIACAAPSPRAGSQCGCRDRAAFRSSPTTTTRTVVALVPRPQHRPSRSSRTGAAWNRQYADRPGRAQRPGARGRDGLHRHAAAAHQLGLRAPPRRRHRSVRPRARAQPAARARREHHRLRRHLEGPRSGTLQGRLLHEIRDAGFTSVRINLHPFKHMDAANGYALRPSLARDARLGGEGCPRGGPRRRARHARVRRDGRRPGRPEGRVARVLAAGGAALQGRARITSRWSC